MGNAEGLPANDIVPFIELGQEHGVEVERPDAIVGFLEANVVVGQAVGDEEQTVLEAKGAAGRDLLDQEVAGVLLRG
jgi:hypothetical protein